MIKEQHLNRKQKCELDHKHTNTITPSTNEGTQDEVIYHIQHIRYVT